MSRVSEWGLVCISLVVSSSCLPPPCRFVFVMRSIVPIKRDVNEPPPQARESKYATLVPEDELLPHAELGREDREESLCCDAERSVTRLCAARLAARELDGEQLAAALVARHHEPAAESDVSSDAEAAQLRWRRLASGAHGLSFGMRKPLPV